MNRQPMTPQQLEALRPKPVAAQPVVDEAKQLAYRSGIAAIEPLRRRLITAEKNIADLTEKVGRLECELLAARCEGRFQ